VRVRILPDAEEEYLEAARWYDGQQPGLGDRFLGALQLAFLRIEESPESQPHLETLRTSRNVRRYLVQGFPFLVVYEILPEQVLVVAVAHGKRRPNYWKDRLGREPRS
jgi:toxin ParE1/3/4